MALHKLVFDTTDATTQENSANVGAYLRSSDGTLITHTTNGSKESVDVFTELGQAEDTAHTSGDFGAMALAVRNDSEGSLVDTDGDYAPLQVDSLGRLRVVGDLDISNLSEKNEDAAHSSGDTGDYVLAVRADARPTNANTDADGDYASFFVNGSGELYVIDTDANALLTTIDVDTGNIATDTAAMVVDLAAIEVLLTGIDVDTNTIAGDTTSIDATLTSLSKAEDSVHSSGDQGFMSLAVRNDAGTALAADGDYIPLTTNSTGDLRVEVSNGDDELANTAISTSQESPTAVSAKLITSDLASRKHLWIYNDGNKDVFIGASGVSISDGFALPAGSILQGRIGASVAIHAVTTAGYTGKTHILQAS